MHKEYNNLSEQIEKFREKIAFYCDCNINLRILFPAFMNLWSEQNSNYRKKDISRKDLAIITSDLLNELIEKGVLCINGEKSDNLYAFYKVLPHKALVNYRGIINDKKALNFK